MKHSIFSTGILAALLLSACAARDPHEVANPDPNHIHVDFAVWVDIDAETIKQVDFSGLQYMSEEYHEGNTVDPHVHPLKQYLHLHDGNGHVIHSHKPGQTVGDFFRSMGGEMITGPVQRSDGRNYPENTIEWPDGEYTVGRSGNSKLHMYVNGGEVVFNPDYVLYDGDKILIITTSNQQQIDHALSMMTDDACLYSKRCPWRGEPPVENCIADPKVPCVE